MEEQRDLPSPTLSQASPQRRKPPEGAEPEAADDWGYGLDMFSDLLNGH